MSRQVEDKPEPQAEDKKRGLFEISRTILLAAVGAAVLAEEEIESFIDKLVDRGELAEKDARKLVREVLDRRDKIVRERQTEQGRSRPVTAATKADIEALNAKIAELSEKLEALKK